MSIANNAAMIVRTLPRPAQPSPTVIHLSLYLLDTVAPMHTHKVIARQSQLQYYAAVPLCRGDASGNGVAVAILAGQLLNHHEPSLQADTNSSSLTQYKYELSCPPGEGSFPRLSSFLRTPKTQTGGRPVCRKAA